MEDDELQHLRQRKDEVFRHDHHSSVPAEQWGSCSGLRYFPPAPDLVFDLPVDPADGSTPETPTSDGSRRRFSCPLPPPEDWPRVPSGAGEAVSAP